MALELDDLNAALGRFALDVGVAGQVSSIRSGGYKISVQKVGICARGNDDFKGAQTLGQSDLEDHAISRWNPLAGTAVSPADFRHWRTANKLGG